MPNLGAPELMIIALIILVGGGGAVIAVVVAVIASLRARARSTPPTRLDPGAAEPQGYVVHPPTPPEAPRS